MNVHIDFLLLPSTILSIIWDYCEPKDILALSSTCRTCKTDIKNWMLVVNGKAFRVHYYNDWRIPVFFSDHCHSIFLTCNVVYIRDDLPVDDGIVVASRRKGLSNGAFDTVAWENKIPLDARNRTFRISLRNDPSQEYCIRRKLHRSSSFEIREIELRKQFMTKSLTPEMKGAITACLSLGGINSAIWHPGWVVYFSKDHVMPFFIKLFVLGVERLSAISSPVSSFVQSRSRRTKPEYIRLVQMEILSFFQQALEQKEPNDCVKFPPSSDEESSIHTMNIRDRRSTIYVLPRVCFKNNFRWRQDKRSRRYHEEDTLFSDELVFVGRIPLVPKATAFTCFAHNHSYSATWQFVVFFHKRQGRGNDSTEYQVYGKVCAGDVVSYCDGVRCTLKPEYDACFLYLVPRSAKTIHLRDIIVQLEIETDASYCDLELWMHELVGGCLQTAPVELRLFPIALFRACALALLGLEEEQFIATIEEFDLVEIDLTPEGLQCIIETCDVILQD